MGLIYDFIGVGFGPSNLALAIAAKEHARDGAQPSFCFLERKPAFSWHEGMLIDGSCMQISFLKDLATLRNPGSRYTFINYLKERGRLEDFINLKTFFPSREEYNDYLGWAAADFAGQVQYGEEVQGVEPFYLGDQLAGVEVLSRDACGQQQRRRARNLVLGLGGAPRLPALFEGLDDPRILHSSRYRGSIEALLADKGRKARVAVVGGGQSAAEIFSDLCDRFEQVDAALLVRGSALKPSDDSPFVNEIFNPSFTDLIYAQSDERRAELFEEFRSTNYSVVDLELIEQIYQRFYLQKLRNEPRHQLLTRCEVLRVEPGREGVELLLRADGGEPRVQRFDAVILATGYRRDQYRRVLAGLGEHLQDFVVGRDYRLPVAGGQLGIYLQGACERSHGLSDTLLSVLAIRSQEVLESILAGRVEERSVRPAQLSQVL